MPNSKLVNKTYNVPAEYRQYLGDTISYENLKMTKSRMTKSKNQNIADYNKKGGDLVLNWIEETLKKDRTAIHSVKDIRKDTGQENQFIKTHQKDKDNANPTNPNSGLIRINKGSTFDRVMTGKERYNESIDKEINQIRYLMEYMNKNKKQKL